VVERLYADAGDPVDLDLGVLLGLAYVEFVDRLRAGMVAAGYDDLGPSHGYVFRALGQGPMTLTELATGLDMTTQGAAKIVDEMVAGAYVRRRPDPSDGRAKQIELDGRGRAALATSRQIHGQLERELVAAAGPRGVATLRRVLGRLVESDGQDPADRFVRPV
jgi:DNA-binding MarR family transcriptional regulator